MKFTEDGMSGQITRLIYPYNRVIFRLIPRIKHVAILVTKYFSRLIKNSE
jgi:hypothetical protein